METLGVVEALRKRVAELELRIDQLHTHNTELLARIGKLEQEAQTMHDLIWEGARSNSRPPSAPSED